MHKMWINSETKKFLSAQIIVEDENRKQHTLMMFNEVLKTIVGDNVTDFKQALLAAGRFKFCIDNGGIVYSVKKC